MEFEYIKEIVTVYGDDVQMVDLDRLISKHLKQTKQTNAATIFGQNRTLDTRIKTEEICIHFRSLRDK